ncbi:hypothetical protein GF322_05035 [Candidatus Dependentiae bacterium]|nr:hypothetical protein [Candidatus Dependentiae bacterium]
MKNYILLFLVFLSCYITSSEALFYKRDFENLENLNDYKMNFIFESANEKLDQYIKENGNKKCAFQDQYSIFKKYLSEICDLEKMARDSISMIFLNAKYWQVFGIFYKDILLNIKDEKPFFLSKFINNIENILQQKNYSNKYYSYSINFNYMWDEGIYDFYLIIVLICKVLKENIFRDNLRYIKCLDSNSNKELYFDLYTYQIVGIGSPGEKTIYFENLYDSRFGTNPNYLKQLNTVNSNYIVPTELGFELF